MIALIVVLLLGIILRWSAVRNGISRGFNWFGDDETEEMLSTNAVPDEQSVRPIEIIE